ncbi:hypothetical protein HDV01_003694, partial [Terramyces sp. JEL0728]
MNQNGHNSAKKLQSIINRNQCPNSVKLRAVMLVDHFKSNGYTITEAISQASEITRNYVKNVERWVSPINREKILNEGDTMKKKFHPGQRSKHQEEEAAIVKVVEQRRMLNYPVTNL